MTAEHLQALAFGTANVTNCEQEQIHLAGSIQPYGALIVVREPGFLIMQESENAAGFLGFGGRLCGLSLQDLGGTIAEQVARLAVDLGGIPVATPCTVGDPTAPYNALVHRGARGELIVELERSGPMPDLSAELEEAVSAVIAAASLHALCETTARIFRDLTGYDRVMVYRFDDDGHGEVLSETRRPDLEAFLGTRYPATDIPHIARRLYTRNRVRLLADIDYQPAAVVPRLSPVSGEDLDMSLCFLRSISPIYVQYLKNMGVSATLVVSLMVSGKLWGLIACHHYAPRSLNFEMRSVCDVLAEVVATRIAALEGFMRGQGDVAARRLEQRMSEWIAREGDWRGALFDHNRPLLLPTGATGAALLFEGEVLTTGDVPATGAIRELGRWLRPILRDGLFSTSNLGAVNAAFEPLAGVASGLLAVPISNQSEEMLIWFRSERVRTVTWAGDPTKAILDDVDPSRLTPRQSFAQWHQIVKGTSDRWTEGDLRAARLIRASVSDVIVQFRSVRVLIAQDQLEQMSEQVRGFDQQVVVADRSGRILQVSAGFPEWLGAEPESLRHLDDLTQYFEDPEHARTCLDSLIDQKAPWRGDQCVVTLRNGPTPTMVRADPIVAASDRALGFVLLFADLAEHSVAESARRRLEDDILRNQRRLLAIGDAKGGAIRRLLDFVAENAQLAALEIAESTEISEVPALLDAVGVSVSRSIEVLERLLRPDRKA